MKFMALYENLDELLIGSLDDWIASVNVLNDKDAVELVAEICVLHLKELTSDQIIQYGQVIGWKCAVSKLKYSQLRRYVDEIKMIGQMPDKISKLKLFRINLLHGYSRQEKELKQFYIFIDGLIKSNKIIDEEDFDAFSYLIDSITAHYEAFRGDSKD